MTAYIISCETEEKVYKGYGDFDIENDDYIVCVTLSENRAKKFVEEKNERATRIYAGGPHAEHYRYDPIDFI